MGFRQELVGQNLTMPRRCVATSRNPILHFNDNWTVTLGTLMKPTVKHINTQVDLPSINTHEIKHTSYSQACLSTPEFQGYKPINTHYISFRLHHNLTTTHHNPLSKFPLLWPLPRRHPARVKESSLRTKVGECAHPTISKFMQSERAGGHLV